MNPFQLFESSGIYKLAILYFSSSRGMAIVGRYTHAGNVEVIQLSGEVDPHTGNFLALDYPTGGKRRGYPVISTTDFENLVAFVSAKIGHETRMSIIEPDIIRSALESGCLQEPSRHYLQ